MSACIMGRIGVKAKRPIPIATARAANPASATTIEETAGTDHRGRRPSRSATRLVVMGRVYANSFIAKNE